MTATRIRAAALAGLALAAPAPAAEPAASRAPRAVDSGVGRIFQFTPDGSRVIYTKGPAKARRLRAVAADGGPPVDLSAGLPETAEVHGYAYVPTPDSRGVVFATVAKEWGGYTCPDRDLYYRAFDADAPVRVGECYSQEHTLDRLAVKPGSSRVVFMGGADGQVGLFATDLATGARTRVDGGKHPEAEVSFYRRLEGGGDRVVWVGDPLEPGARGLYLADLDAPGDPVHLTADLPPEFSVVTRQRAAGNIPEEGDAFQVTPDGSTVVFGAAPSDSDGFSFISLWAVDIDGGDVRQLIPASTSWGVQNFTISPDGRWVATRNFDIGMGVAVASVDGASWRFVHGPTAGFEWTNHPRIGPAGEWVYFWGDLESQEQEHYLYRAALDGGEAEKIAAGLPRAPEFILNYRQPPGAAGAYLHCQVYRRKGYRLQYLPFDGGEPRMVSGDERYTNVGEHRVMPDGGVVFLEAKHEKLAARVFRWAPGWDAARPLSPDFGPKRGAEMFAVAPGSGRLAYLVSEKGKAKELYLGGLGGGSRQEGASE